MPPAEGVKKKNGGGLKSKETVRGIQVRGNHQRGPGTTARER